MTTLPHDAIGDGPALLFLHSFPLDRSMWRRQLDRTVAHGHRAIAPDLPGFGAAAPPVDPPSLEGHAAAVIALLDHLAIARATVVGLSLGGYVALTLARLHPQRLAGLVLADTRAAADTPLVKAGRVMNMNLVKKQGPGAMLDKLLPGLVAPGTPPETLAHIRSIAARQSADGIVSALLAMRDRPDATPTLATIAVPTLVLVGEHDAVTPPAEMQRMAEAIPNAEFAMIPGAGHLSNLEKPEDFNRLLFGFVTRHAAGSLIG